VPRGTQGCCDQPGFIVPTFFVNILGGLCSRVDQIDCGVGVVNTSNPQTGDNDVIKMADTSDPGADCCYNGHPASECLGGVDMNGDACGRAGSGFIAPTNADTDGPITVPGGAAGPLRPQSYDGTVGPVTGAVSEVFSGPNSPIRDIGFVAITPNTPAVVVPAVTCSCTPVAGCPE